MTENNIPTCKCCGAQLEWFDSYSACGYRCPIEHEHYSALRSEVEALRKRNEALEEFKNCVEAITEQITLEEPKKPKDLTVESLQVWMAQHHTWGREGWARVNGLQAMLARSESRAQQLETKLRAAEDAVVALTEKLRMIADEGVADLGWQGTALAQRAHARQALSNTSALAAHRKREIVREALESERTECCALIPEALKSYNLTHTSAEDPEQSFGLVDALTPPSESDISLGLEEVEFLADHIAGEIKDKRRAAILNPTEPA